jgi:integrase
MTAPELAALKALVAAEEGRQAADQLSENPIEETEGGTAKGNAMCRIDGPFPHHTKFRVRVVDRETGKTTRYTYDTKEQALAAIPKLRLEYRRPTGVTLAVAFEAYATYLATERQNRASTIETTIGRITALFRNQQTLTDDLTPADVRKLFDAFKKRPITKAGKLPSVDSQVGVLKQSRTFALWLHKRGLAKRSDLFEGLEVLGKRHQGKPQLRIDDARTYEKTARELADRGDVGAIAALVPLYMGNRAGEVVGRRVRDLDNRGTLLHIEEAKTEAGNRPLEIPAVLQPYLAKLAKGKQPDAPLFTGGTPRARRSLEALADPVAWLRRQVWRMCKLASVPRVGPHGLRGTHSSLAAAAGATSAIIASAMGHSGSGVTERHYIKPEALENARTARVVAALN